MSLKSDDVRAIAHLARLHIDDDAIDRYAADLSSILDLVEQMSQVDSSAVRPLPKTISRDHMATSQPTGPIHLWARAW